MSEHTTGQLVIFSLGEEEYGLPISCVHEIIRFTEPRTVASPDPSVRGVISLRGKIIPVFDLATRLGLQCEGSDNQKIVIVETTGALAGVVVDDVEEVLTIGEDQLDAGGGWDPLSGEGIDAIAKIEDRLVVLLSPERIVAGASGSAYGAETTAPTAAAPAEALAA
jgi:purine-binding chemotaxis protein CheW